MVVKKNLSFKIILATASPRRKDLFSKIGLKFKKVIGRRSKVLG
jgi:predicted house-cleaning NTP pyrophosphatase (Maf/HAM1 superfamily)